MGRAVFTDLDGTLLGSDQNLSPANHDVLEELGQHGILRVVITGRSLFFLPPCSQQIISDRHLGHLNGSWNFFIPRT